MTEEKNMATKYDRNKPSQNGILTGLTMAFLKLLVMVKERESPTRSSSLHRM
ncbi:hypothetical protein JCM19037_1486 [Geomicrobium sp. JCM 19037]|nr:hypothetical protein JCM19037_1486 [Geomicrobium sp. JCM 19037]